MKRRRRAAPALGLVALAALALAGCGGDAAEGRPPAILYGADICDHCRMVISEERHAAGARVGLADYRFDDPGCLSELLDAGAADESAVAWVHDENAAWLLVEDAWFARDPHRGTPMGSGILAFGSETGATAAAEELGVEPWRWAERHAVIDSEVE